MFSGALLDQAESLLKMGLSPSDVIEGYEMASTKALEILPCVCCDSVIRMYMDIIAT